MRVFRRFLLLVTAGMWFMDCQWIVVGYYSHYHQRSRSFTNGDGVLINPLIKYHVDSSHYHRVTSQFATLSPTAPPAPPPPSGFDPSTSFPSSPSSSQTTARVPKGASPEFIIDGDSTIATWDQKALTYTHFALVVFNLWQVAMQLFKSGTIIDFFTMPLIVYLATVIGDLGTGIFHWSVDNYGSLKTPIFGPICVAFQGHHQTPWTITFRPFSNNLYKIAIATIPFLSLLAFFSLMNIGWKLFLTLFINYWLLSQELHKYAHMKPDKIPRWIQWLQQNNWIISRKEHGLHHLSPFEGHYCIVNGMNNAWLDSTQFFRYLEKIIFLITGNRPITWEEDPSLERIAMSKKIFW